MNTVIYSKSNMIARITLNRPEVINAYNTQMRDELYEALIAVRDDREIRVLIISGNGKKGFCSGADLTEFGSTPSQIIARSIKYERDIWTLLNQIQQPIIAALHGYVIGSGLEIACFCDIRIAAEDTVFKMPELSLSLIPAAGGTQTLSRIINYSQALNIILSNKYISATEAKDIGLIKKIVKKKNLNDQVNKLANQLSKINPNSIHLAKNLIKSSKDLSSNNLLQIEKTLL
ncbi:MAG: hypothetical protein CL758_02250 [Chloroflexi bacterium]|nr:hypothetical protein [Chloroflexota bacterium]